EQALRQGACGLIISEKDRIAQIEQQVSPAETTGISPHSRPFVILVDETLNAIQSIARVCRQKHAIPLIAVTGSNGKTTVKDMTASILGVHYGNQVLKSEKSFNNHIGLPLTLANMTERHAVAVVEIGMNAPGEIRHLAGIAKPEIGAVTNIALAHIGFFDSLEAVMQAKMELIEALPDDGCAVLNRDDMLFEQMLACLRGDMDLIKFGIARESEKLADPVAPASHHNLLVKAERIIAAPDGTYSFEVHTPVGRFPISLNIPGYHNISNALAAASNAIALLESLSQVSLDEIKQGLEHFDPSPMRMQKFTQRRITFINDAYNANPASMTSALDTLRSMACQGKKIAILGDMLELGRLSQTEHFRVGALAAQIPVDWLFLFGEYADEVARGAQTSGMASHQIIIGTSRDQLAEEILSRLEEGDLVLCKASRAIKMEIVLERILNLLGD
ncbi:MAG: UDP-N-acetylmuramoyl-tripeptide--D-alanyl-D-alanine ligase, partial [Candidatus Vecturithrix sp.]|nr:UDP-N-acetylmuramoyl-tripeptide--D-alanyl-D-alanine ligase [Candidatus Vecturithrix sp.]